MSRLVRWITVVALLALPSLAVGAAHLERGGEIVVNEDVGYVDFLVVGATDGALVYWDTIDGGAKTLSADSGPVVEDYNAPPGPGTAAFGGRTGARVLIIDDSIPEDDEDFAFLITGISVGSLEQPVAASVTIKDNDLRPGRCANLLTGTPGKDTLRGTRAGGDLLRAFAGDDRLEGFTGHDCLEGGLGRDVLFGGEGNDRLDGGPGNDEIIDGEATDPAGSDVLLGREGNDLLDGQKGNDRVEGGPGNDRVLGSFGRDVLTGGPGADEVVGGSGRDRILGNGGNDLLQARDGERDFVDCGPGRDVANVDRFDVLRPGCETVRRR